VLVGPGQRLGRDEVHHSTEGPFPPKVALAKSGALVTLAVQAAH
jgi:hypothetical protein